MPALPDQWQYSVQAVGAGPQAVITIPAAPGVRHVVDHVEFRNINTAAASVAANQNCQVSDGGTTIFITRSVLAAGIGRDVVGSDGPLSPGTPGAQMVVSFTTVTVANQINEITVTGHDL